MTGVQTCALPILRNADSVNDLRLQIKLQSARARNTDLAAGTEHMKVV